MGRLLRAAGAVVVASRGAVAPKPSTPDCATASRPRNEEPLNEFALPQTGTIATTVVEAEPVGDWVTNHPEVGQRIYGPFEAGFDCTHMFTLSKFGCDPVSDGYMPGGIDTTVAQGVIEYQCGVELPRYEGDKYLSMLDKCGGHYTMYHYHERLNCLYDADKEGHSTRIAETNHEKGVYGLYEDTLEVPEALDACGAHFGVTPDSGGESV